MFHSDHEQSTGYIVCAHIIVWLLTEKWTFLHLEATDNRDQGVYFPTQAQTLLHNSPKKLVLGSITS